MAKKPIVDVPDMLSLRKIIDLEPSAIVSTSNDNFRELEEWANKNRTKPSREFGAGVSDGFCEPVVGIPLGSGGGYYASFIIDAIYQSPIFSLLTVTHNSGKDIVGYYIIDSTWPIVLYSDRHDRTLWNREQLYLRFDANSWPPPPPEVDVQVRIFLFTSNRE